MVAVIHVPLSPIHREYGWRCCGILGAVLLKFVELWRGCSWMFLVPLGMQKLTFNFCFAISKASFRGRSSATFSIQFLYKFYQLQERLLRSS